MRFFILAALVLTTGCASSNKVVLGKGHQIDSVRLEGVTRFSKGRLLQHLHAGEASWLPFSPDYPHDDALVAVDYSRIEALYRSYGYYDAVVEAIETVPRPEDEEVDLVIRVNEGEPVLVRYVDLAWLSSPISEEDRHGVVEALELFAGEPLEIEKLNASIGSLRTAMLIRGYPLARVHGAADVDELTRKATVRFELSSGPRATVGDIRFEGLVDVPAYLCRNEVEYLLDAPWSPAIGSQVEAILRGMQVFQWVAAQPPTEVRDGKVDVVVRVAEARPHKISTGFQMTLETVRWQEQIRIDYTNTNLFGHLTRLDLRTAFGWAELPNPFDPIIHGPVVQVAPRFSKKGLFEPQLLWSWTPSYELDVQEGYQNHTIGTQLGVSRWLAGGLFNVAASHNLSYVDFFNLSPELSGEDTPLGRDFRDPFLLSFFELVGKAFFVNDIGAPTDGAILEARYRLSGQFLGSAYDFNEFQFGVQGFWKPFSRLQFAARAKVGAISPFGDAGASPFSFNYYLGGATTVRGWGSRRISPRLKCAEDDEECKPIPIGGRSMIQANLEARVFLFWKLSLVAFADMGDVQAAALTFRPEHWNFTAGPGLRVETPLGLVRLDFGWRLNDPGVFPDKKRWGLHFGLGEAF